jgi:hypothetical protein
MQSVGSSDRMSSPFRMLTAVALLTQLLSQAAPVLAQDPATRPRLAGLAPAGGKQFLTNHDSVLGFRLTNPRATDLQARVLTFYQGETETQYGRDLWVPAHASIWSWFTLGPPAAVPKIGQVELKSIVRELSAGDQKLVRSGQDPPLGSHLIPFEIRHQLTTLMLDSDISDGSQTPTPPEKLEAAEHLRDLIHSMRHEVGMSPRINSVRERFLPPIAEAYEGIDQFVLASDRLVADVDGQRGLRAWLENGGHLWIPLDWVEQGTVTTLLGDLLNLQIVDRTSLTSVRFEMGPGNPYLIKPETREYEEPVPFVRVLAPQQQVYYTVEGWPAAFVTQVGKGRVLFTTLGARAWVRPRTKADPESRYQDLPTLPVGLVPTDFLAQEVLMNVDRPLLTPNDFRPYVSSQISYEVVSRASVLIVFGLLFLVLIAAFLILGKKQVLEHMGWLAPVLAGAAALAFFWLGERARSAVPPTVAVAQAIVAEPETGQAQASGLMAIYQPGFDKSEVIGARAGGDFTVDTSGLEGRVHSRLQTDVKRWHWDHLELPSGVRLAPFRYTAPLDDTIGTTLLFGPVGLEGRVQTGSLGALEDVLITTPGRHALPVDVSADGSLHAAGGDSLETGHLLMSGLLTDQQRARQTLYEKLLASPQPQYLATRSLLLGWIQPLDMHFSLVAEARTTGMALVAVPLRFERTPPGTRVIVPSTFVESQRVGNDGRLAPTAHESGTRQSMKIRFQVPASVLPVTLESARLTFRLLAPLREVSVTAFKDGQGVLLSRLSNPIGNERIEISDPQLLQVDKAGCLYINIEVGDLRGEDRNVWRLEWASLEVRGRTLEQREGLP